MKKARKIIFLFFFHFSLKIFDEIVAPDIELYVTALLWRIAVTFSCVNPNLTGWYQAGVFTRENTHNIFFNVTVKKEKKENENNQMARVIRERNTGGR